MFAAISSWDIVASGGAFNAPPGAAPPDMIDSGAAISSCERVVLLSSPDNAIRIGLQSRIS
jgi:hypothetical protein